MDPFNAAPDIIIDLIFLQLNEDDLHETLRVSKTWFWASIRRIKKLKIALQDNPLEPIAEFYNRNRGCGEREVHWLDLFSHLVLGELIVNHHDETRDYLLENGCNTAELTIKSLRSSTPVTLASLKRVHRLQSFEFCTFRGNYWHPFIKQCIKSADSGFDFNLKCQIEAIKLNSSGWNTEGPVLQSVTKLSFWRVTIEFLRAMVNLCPNLEQLYCSDGIITQDWHQLFPANIKTIKLHDVSVDYDVATIVDASTDSARHLLPYLCQNWESVEQFHFYGVINMIGRTVYDAFPQHGEEVFVCQEFNREMNLASLLLKSREVVKSDPWKASRLRIPPATSVKLKFYGKRKLRFLPGAACLEPGKVEHLALSLINYEGVNPDPLGPNSFQGFCRLTSLALSHVSTLPIKMALDQCPSIKKLQRKHLKAFNFGNMSRSSSYTNVCELLLERCEESMRKVFQVFPSLSEFKLSSLGKDEIRKKTEIEEQLTQIVPFYFIKSCQQVDLVILDIDTVLDEFQKPISTPGPPG